MPFQTSVILQKCVILQGKQRYYFPSFETQGMALNDLKRAIFLILNIL